MPVRSFGISYVNVTLLTVNGPVWGLKLEGWQVATNLELFIETMVLVAICKSIAIKLQKTIYAQAN